MKLDKKKAIVEELHEKFSKSKIVILTDYKGLDVAAVSELRKKLNEVNVEFKVVKNTLLVRASEDTEVALIKDDFKGPSAVAMSYDDPVAPAKVMTEFAGGNDKFEIKIGVMNGKRIDVKAIKALSSLPSREVLLAQVLSAMNGVPTAFVRVLNAVPQKLLYALQAIKEQKEAA
ncbi:MULTISPECIES: 50S ribosomal protein L10 [Desulfococcus]|jgi:large subunit ribosomal protein L10|uniref:Large ribosomal subunit protein uL10 n=1 Tax=Desulfococcus multivorans DSM 2059 TaxID=1121405 RepID=S7T5Z4_DESML|nr:50S ribosomal protein L10 [Desulfococcus multivorans]AOY59763.1 RplJ: 50S ribosomal protein L10 [Desulfococcus multivorans]AQV01936.1 50S ribosomal protein L10 [Desulfococcus multivorans]EPR32477.1 50S ribosomal protein L10 [Desulfococcus multivorans DSM 2059]SKA28814.1 LSU ribosomal protein L10P [Desulfococcus multivorans DSM 2059]